MVVYFDLFIAQNIIINYFLLYLTSFNLKIKVKPTKLIIASIIGCSYSSIVLFSTKINFIYSFPFKIIVALVMIFVSFRNSYFYFKIKALIIFIMYSILIAGSYFLITINLPFKYHSFIRTIFFTAIIVYFICNRTIVFINDRNSQYKLTYKIQICFKKYTSECNAFFDTGNEMREPATNLPIIIVEKDKVPYATSEIERYSINCKGINGDVLRLKGFKPDYVLINNNGKQEEKDAIIAVCDNKLDCFGMYNALLSRGIIM